MQKINMILHLIKSSQKIRIFMDFKKVLPILAGMFLALITLPANAQIGEIKLDDWGGFGKFSKFGKKIYIAEFTVNYQVLYEAKKSKAAGQFGVGGHYKGASEAKGALGLKDMSTELLQKMTDDLYAKYINDLKTNGFEIITSDQAANIDVYQKMELVSGGKPFVQFPGTISCNPTGYSYFIEKGIKSKLGKFGNIVDNTPVISKDLGDAVVAKVCLNVQFAQSGQQFIKTGSSVKMKTNLALVQNMVASEIAEEKLLRTKENDIESIASYVNFTAGKKMASAEAAYNGTLKKDVGIQGVIEDEKVNAFADGRGMASGYQMVGTNYAILFYENDVDKDLKEVEVDLPNYEKYVGEALEGVLMGHTKIFLDNY